MWKDNIKLDNGNKFKKKMNIYFKIFINEYYNIDVYISKKNRIYS